MLFFILFSVANFSSFSNRDFKLEMQIFVDVKSFRLGILDFVDFHLSPIFVQCKLELV